MSVPPEPTATRPAPQRRPRATPGPLSPFQEYLAALLAVAAASGIGYIIRPWSDYWAVAVIYLFTIVLLGLRLGQGPILFAATLCALTWDFLFFPPLFTFLLPRLEDWMMLGLFFVIAIVTGRLTGHIRRQEQTERLRAQRATALHQLTRVLATAQSAEEVLRKAAGQVAELFGANLAILTADPVEPDRLVPHPSGSYAISGGEQQAALRVFHERRKSGGSARIRPGDTNPCFPLVAGGRVLGVMAVQPALGTILSPAQCDLLDDFATQIALALEHEQLRTANEAARIRAASDRLHRTLLDSVSHELKTPLAVIASAAESLRATMPAEGQPLVGEIHLASERLRRLVVNLLDTTRLESGGLNAQLDWCDLADLVNAALKITAHVRAGRTVQVRLPPDLPLVRCDFDLMLQALANLLHNACHHTPPTAEVIVSAGVGPAADRVWLAVADTGPGLREDQAARLFERFFRGQPKKAGGIGLGLSIARGFVEAHGGTLTAANRPEGGALFTISLPLDRHDSIPGE